ncbi:MAG: hypothetical protein QG657_969 [Acidobacteriota bacterium]|nr:hypothetical protein [Acidobacteriota bacterium]
MNYKNLVEMFCSRRRQDIGITFIDSAEEKRFLSYDEIYLEAGAILFNLQSAGVKPGDQLVFQINDNRDFVIFFWACLLGKIIPIPVTLAANDEYMCKLFNIWRLLSRPYLITFEKHLETLKAFAVNNNYPDMIAQMEKSAMFIEKLHRTAGHGHIYIPDESDIAYIQFSSGSTGSPKGVVLTHKNLLTNIKAIIKGIKPPVEGDVFFSWMPLTHDMGIIGFHMVPYTADWNHYLMIPQLFIRRPHLWLRKIAETKSTMTVSPNFGYKYVLKHFEPDKYNQLDLSSLRLIVNGAEPISADVCQEFLNKFTPFGLKKTVIFPVYGLAEASLAVSFSEPEDEMVVVNVDRDSLSIGQKVTEREKGVKAISFVEVGTPIPDCFVRIVDEAGERVADRIIGGIEIKGENVTGGYYNNDEATTEAIRPDGWLKTGDIGFSREGRLVITGRAKEIIFVNAQNVYPHDIEREAEKLEGMDFEKIAVCGVYNEASQSDEIICFVVFKRNLEDFLPLVSALKKHIAEKMSIEIDKIIPVKIIPKTTSGKVQRYKLRKEYLDGMYNPVIRELSGLQNEITLSKLQLTKTEIRKIIAETWKHVLGKDNVGEFDNFFDVGGDSTRAVQIKGRLQEAIGKAIDDAVIFRYPTINALTDYLSTNEPDMKFAKLQRENLDLFCHDRYRIQERIKKYLINETGENSGRSGLDIAVIGMSGRFPGAGNIDDFWNNLINGIESITFFSQEELSACGIDQALLENTDYVRAKGVLENIEYFDAFFFGYSPQEAGEMDPQTRIFHLCLWEALEDAGYDPDKYRGLIGVYAGASPNPIWNSKPLLLGRISASEQFMDIQLLDKDFMATRLSYKLNLKGPSFNMYTACSTSLVAIDLACQGLLTAKCDLALAGGVSLSLPYKTGYLYEAGMLFSRDGHNRTFDEQASGTVFSDGAGIVVLKRLEEAMADGDHIYAVVKGSAVNNDGSRKVGYTAPALEGQAEVIAVAHQAAGIDPETIGYVEAHGTATSLGDVIEMKALTLAFQTQKTGYCAIGSVKSNIGHLNAAAGVAGFIKTVLSLYYCLIPPSLHFRKPNNRIDFENSPFYVNIRLKEWSKNDIYPSSPRRAGVSSFGIGGTNAHAVLEEAPPLGESSIGREWKILILSARTQESLDSAIKSFLEYLNRHPTMDLADIAYTLQVGRKSFQYRKMLLCSDNKNAIEIISSPKAGKIYTSDSQNQVKRIVFMFSGQGAQYVNMGLGLYRIERIFREEMDICFNVFQSIAGYDLKEILYPSENLDQAAKSVKKTEITQPLVFIFEYALAKLLLSWGIKPEVMIGYSFGEYTAACLSGVFSLEDALKLVILRGQLMQKMPKGAMLSVPLSMKKVNPFLNGELSLAIDNGASCIVSGTSNAIEAFENELKDKGYLSVRVNVSYAGHSTLMEPILAEFENEVRKTTLNPPGIPFISNVTAQTITAEEATNSQYWVKHMKDTVRFGEGIGELLKTPNSIFLEIGPGQDLCALVKNHENYTTEQRLVNLVRHEKKTVPDIYYLLNRLGHLWLYGIDIDWEKFYVDEKRRRVSLPVYNFQHQRFPLDVDYIHLKNRMEKYLETPMQKRSDIDQWLYIPSWKRTRLPGPLEPSAWDDPVGTILLFIDEGGLGNKIEMQLRQEGFRVLIVREGDDFTNLKEDEYTVKPAVTHDYDALFGKLRATGQLPHTIIHLWSVSVAGNGCLGLGEVERYLDKGFYSLLALAQALGKMNAGHHFQLKVVTNNAQDVIGGDLICPEKATLMGPVKAIAQEFSNIGCCLIDITLPESEVLVGQLMREFKIKTRDGHENYNQDKDIIIAYRNNHRWILAFEPVNMKKSGSLPAAGLREKGVYLVTGGLGGMGLILAEYLAVSVKAKLVLIDRVSLPGRDEWDNWLSSHPNEDKTGEKIRKIRELEASGAEVLLSCADVTDESQMQQVISQAQQHFGSINGIIHAAGIADGAMIMRRTRELSEEILAPKVMGTLVIHRLVQYYELDFFIFCSSMAAIFPLPGQTAYAAANAFLDAFAASRFFNSGTIAISINWDRWQNVGVSVIAEQKHKDLWGKAMEEGITPPEGIDVFRRILADPMPRVVVSTIDLEHMTDRFNASGMLSTDIDIVEEQSTAKPRHQRPELSVSYVEPGNEIEQKLVEIWQELLGIDRVGIHDNFFELGGDSLKGMKFVNRYNTLLNEIVHINIIFEAPTITELAGYIIKNYPEAAGAITGRPISPDSPGGEPGVDMEIIERVRHLLPSPPSLFETQSPANPPAIFILSPPRSGTTLLRVMLAGHPKLFAPPELGLLSYNTLNEVNFTLQSSIRALMEIKGCDVEEAGRMIREFQQRIMTTKQFYRVLQEGIGDRLLVDKTPDYSFSLEVLKKAESDFSNSLYIHLIRHPYGMIHSFEEARLDLLFSNQSTHDLSLSRRRIAEAIWFISHRNILEFLENIPQNRQHWIKFEDLVYDPYHCMEGICRFLNLEFHPGMIQPYKEQNRRMTDSTHSEGRMIGDVKFMRHKHIDPGVADNWRDHYHTDFLGDVTWKMAEKFGYKSIKSDRLSLEPVEKKEYYPASVAQKKFFIINEFENISETYNTFRYVPLSGKLNIARFENAWRALIRRQESLRTSFHLIAGQPVIKVHETADFEIEYVDLIESGNPEYEMKTIINKFRTPFDLTQPPLMRVKLVKMSGENHVMLFGMHHIITDGYSMEIIFEELVALYGGKQLPGLKLQYKDYAQWQHRFLEFRECKKQEVYWLEKFSGEIPLLNMPTDYPRPKSQSFEGEWIHFKLENHVTQNIHVLAEDTGATVYMVLLAAFNILLSRYTGQKDIIVGSPIAGRDLEELERVIGVFMNVIPMRTLIEEEKTFAGFLSSVKENLLMAFKNHLYPLGMLAEKLGIIKNLSRNPLNDVEFIMIRNNLSLLEVEGLKFVPTEFNVGTSPVDITLAVVESGNDFSFTLMYCTKLFKRETIEKFIDSYKEVLRTVTQNKDILLKSITVSTGLGEALPVFLGNNEDFGF